METAEAPRGSPEAPAATTVPAAALAPASSLNQETSATERARGANSPQAIRSLLSDLRKSPVPKPAEAKPSDAPAPEAPAAEAQPETQPEAEPEVNTPVDADPAADPTPDGGDDPSDDEGGASPITPITGKRAHLRLPPESDKVGRLALSILKRNQDFTLEEATARAKEQLGIKPEAPPAAEEPAKSDLPTTVEAVDAEQDRLFAERKKAYSELRFEDVADFDEKMRKLDRHRLNLEREADRQQTVAAQQYDQAFTKSEARAAELYEFAGNPESPGAKRMLEIDAALKENDDPLYSSPDKPLRIAQMVAAELKIAPRRKGQPAAPAKAAAPAQPVPKKQVIPGGGSSTIPPASNPTTAVAEQVSGIKTVHDLRKFLKPLTTVKR